MEFHYLMNRIMNKKITERRIKRIQKHKKISRGKRSPTLYNLFFSHRMKEEKEKDSCKELD